MGASAWVAVSSLGALGLPLFSVYLPSSLFVRTHGVVGMAIDRRWWRTRAWCCGSHCPPV